MTERGFGRNVEAVFGTWDRKFHPLARGPLAAVELNKEKDEVTFTFEDGSKAVYGVEGDCCSHSWVEHVEIVGDVKGAKVIEVSENTEDATGDEARNQSKKEKKSWETDEEFAAREPDNYEREHESLQVYQTTFKTDRACVITLEYRNSSNGYYGGNLTDPRIVEPDGTETQFDRYA